MNFPFELQKNQVWCDDSVLRSYKVGKPMSEVDIRSLDRWLQVRRQPDVRAYSSSA
jgi:hypothetical protein